MTFRSMVKEFEVSNYSLGPTLNSGQAFRWTWREGGWEGVIGRRWVRLVQTPGGIGAETADPVEHWTWLSHYLQLEINLASILETFPPDPFLRDAALRCAGLRLLRQEPWECLASFILSSTKQIPHIRQIIAEICCRFGETVATPPGHAPAFAFPSPALLANCSEASLRACKMGFRARYLREAARMIAESEVRFDDIGAAPLEEARQGLMKLPGVGRKIADCVLLFAFGFQQAFPVDVWILKILREHYFRGRKPRPAKLESRIAAFGPFAGYAQQYLFHHARNLAGRVKE